MHRRTLARLAAVPSAALPARRCCRAQTKRRRSSPTPMKILDPTFTTAYITRNFGSFMICPASTEGR
jgi:hypothetical protein